MAYNPYDSKSPYGNNPYGGGGNPYGQPPPQQQPAQMPSGPYGQTNQYQQGAGPYSGSSRPPPAMDYSSPLPPPPPPPPSGYPAPQQQSYGNGVPGEKYSAGQNIEMNQYQGGQPGGQSQYTTVEAGRRIMDECVRIDQEIRKTKASGAEFDQIQRAHKAFASSDDSSTLQEIEQQSKSLMERYRRMGRELKEVKKLPGAQSNPQYAGHVSKCQRAIEKALNDIRVEDERFRTEVVTQQARQYQIANAGMSLQDAMRMAENDNGNTNVFQQQLANTNRYGQANATLGAVQARHEAIQNIEKQFMEIAEMMNELAMTVEEQQPMIEKIEQNATVTHENMETGNQNLGAAIVSAKKARRKKWWCFWILVAIIIIVAVIVVAYGATQGWFKKNDGNNNNSSSTNSPATTTAAAAKAKRTDGYIPLAGDA